MTLKRIEELLEIEFAKVACLSVKEHINVLGDKQKYINAAINAHSAVVREIKKDVRALITYGGNELSSSYNRAIDAVVQIIEQKMEVE